MLDPKDMAREMGSTCREEPIEGDIQGRSSYF
jgi:hypothetical protein